MGEVCLLDGISGGREVIFSVNVLEPGDSAFPTTFTDRKPFLRIVLNALGSVVCFTSLGSEKTLKEPLCPLLWSRVEVRSSQP